MTQFFLLKLFVHILEILIILKVTLLIIHIQMTRHEWLEKVLKVTLHHFWSRKQETIWWSRMYLNFKHLPLKIQFCSKIIRHPWHFVLGNFCVVVHQRLQLISYCCCHLGVPESATTLCVLAAVAVTTEVAVIN